VGAVAGFVALVAGRAELAYLAAPLLGALAAGWLSRPPSGLQVRIERDVERCFEGEQFSLRAEVASQPAASALNPIMHTPAGLNLRSTAATYRGGTWRAEWLLRAARWGRWPLGTLTLDVHAAGGLLAAHVRIHPGRVDVYPRAPEPHALKVPTRLVQQLGEHVSPSAGHGSEFTGVRPYQHGLPVRRINWAVTSRRRALHVNTYGAEHALDLVTVIDAYTDVGPPGATSLDLAVRGATALAHAHLRYHDRAGAIVLGTPLHWLRPDLAQRHYYRIVEHILDMPRWRSAAEPDLTRVPPTALPPGALVVMFSPLLDGRAIDLARDLRRRGFPLIIIDVLNAEPPAGPAPLDRLALRLWRLDREALRHSLGILGIPVLYWQGDELLDVALARLPHDAMAGAFR
jgi:uncharacterized protein (DUF58 family)